MTDFRGAPDREGHYRSTPRGPQANPAGPTDATAGSNAAVGSTVGTRADAAAHQRALDYLYGRINYERRPAPSRGAYRLQRMRELLETLGRPDRSMRIVHVGGTKGKGSTAAMVAAMLSGGGFSTGLYTSPHLTALEERFQIDGRPCPAQRLVELVEPLRAAVERTDRRGRHDVTFFELTTALALLHFARAGVDWAVLEVGLGGRLDSTNVVDPAVSVITTVGLDHQAVLGDTLEKIAREKAGIIKPGVPVVSGVTDRGARRELERVAADRAAPLRLLGRDFHVRSSPPSDGGWGIQLDYESDMPGAAARRGWRIGLAGRHQAENAAVALAVVDQLAAEGVHVPAERQRRALADVRCPARLEWFGGAPPVLLDAAHNADSIAALVALVAERFPETRPAVVLGTSVDKDAAEMLRALAPRTGHLVLTRFLGNPRWRDPHELARLWCGAAPCEVEPQPLAALERARAAAGADGLVVVCGSFFLAAELRPSLVGEGGKVEEA